MYTAREASQLRQEFWTTFGKYMAPLPSADGEKVNWINYKTGEQHIAFKMDATERGAVVGIVFTHPDAGIRALYFEQLQQLKQLFLQTAGNDWIWSADTKDIFSYSSAGAYSLLNDISIFNREHWPALISFFLQVAHHRAG